MMEQFGGRGGGRGGGRRGGAPPVTASVEQAPLTADKIDELFLPTPVRQRNGSVWTWDEAGKKLTETRVVVGLADNQFSQLLSGDVKPGQQVVTSIIVPLTTAQRNAQNPLFGGGRGNFGGMQPGGGGDGAATRATRAASAAAATSASATPAAGALAAEAADAGTSSAFTHTHGVNLCPSSWR